MAQKKERWASRFGLVLAMAGNAVGLGNFLRFPAQAAKNGGGAFLIPYFVALLLLGLPLIWVEWAMGRYGGQHGHHSAPGIFQVHHRARFWKYFGVLGLWTCLTISAYYLYIESWTMAYAGYSLIGGFTGKTTNEVDAFFKALTGEQPNSLVAVSGFGMTLFAICVVINIFILSRGLAKGIELVCKVGMPLLIIFAAVLAVRGMMISPETDPKAQASPLDGLNFVWQPRYTSLADPEVWLAAAGQIFFTISIGMGSMHCYASYLRETDDVALTGQTAGWTNEFCEVILGGSILIPIAVAYLGLPEVVNMTSGGSGFGLGFVVFPSLFSNWGPVVGPVAGFLWFGLLFFAAITSSLAMGQPILAFLQQEFDLPRHKSALLFGAMLLPLALCVALTHSNAFFDEFDFWAGSFALVVFAMGESILFAWLFGIDKGWEQINRGAEIRVPLIFKYIIKYVTPVFLMAILSSFILSPAVGWKAYLQALVAGQPLPKWEWSGGGMIGKLLHRDLDETRTKQLANIDEQILDLRSTPDQRAAKLRQMESEMARIAQDNTLLEYERNARQLTFEASKKRLVSIDQMSAADRETKRKELLEQRDATTRFFDQLRVTRNIDRLVMIAVYGVFCALVYVGFSRKSRKD
jgi:SNF family Na+-dependent transporter